MCVGELPFKDCDIQKTMNKILFSKPFYPETLSTELRDIIERMLTKPQDQRITLDDIKRHAWFSPREYSYIIPFIEKQASSFSFTPQDLPKYEQYGLSTQTLRQSLFTRQYNEETAVMRIIKRNDLIDEMKYSLYVVNNKKDYQSKIISPTPSPKSPNSDKHEDFQTDVPENEGESVVPPKVYHRAQRQRNRAFSSNKLPPNLSPWY